MHAGGGGSCMESSVGGAGAAEEGEVQAPPQVGSMPWSVLCAAPMVINHLMLCEMHAVVFEQLPQVRELGLRR